jgi:hypothetical protein
LASLVAPALSGTFDVSRKFVVPRTLASCAALLVLGVFHGGLSLAVAPVFCGGGKLGALAAGGSKRRRAGAKLRLIEPDQQGGI